MHASIHLCYARLCSWLPAPIFTFAAQTSVPLYSLSTIVRIKHTRLLWRRKIVCGLLFPLVLLSSSSLLWHADRSKLRSWILREDQHKHLYLYFVFQNAYNWTLCLHVEIEIRQRECTGLFSHAWSGNMSSVLIAVSSFPDYDPYKRTYTITSTGTDGGSTILAEAITTTQHAFMVTNAYDAGIVNGKSLLINSEVMHVLIYHNIASKWHTSYCRAHTYIGVNIDGKLFLR